LQKLTTAKQSVADYFKARLSAKTRPPTSESVTSAIGVPAVDSKKDTATDTDDVIPRFGLGALRTGMQTRSVDDEEPIRVGIGSTSKFAAMFAPVQATAIAVEVDEQVEVCGAETEVVALVKREGKSERKKAKAEKRREREERKKRKEKGKAKASADEGSTGKEEVADEFTSESVKATRSKKGKKGESSETSRSATVDKVNSVSPTSTDQPGRSPSPGDVLPVAMGMAEGSDNVVKEKKRKRRDKRDEEDRDSKQKSKKRKEGRS